MTSLAFIGNIGTPQLIIILVIGLLIFGRRLPEVGKSVGKTIVEFKKGLKGVEAEISEASKEDDSQPAAPQQHIAQQTASSTENTTTSAPEQETQPAEKAEQTPPANA